jgi:hypothetical protein
MWNAATGGSSMQTESEVDNHGSVVVNLQSLIGHIQASIAMVEAAVASEFCDGNQDAAADIFVLDDVTPPYETAHAALKASGAGLGAALQLILDAKSPDAKSSVAKSSVAKILVAKILVAERSGSERR